MNLNKNAFANKLFYAFALFLFVAVAGIYLFKSYEGANNVQKANNTAMHIDSMRFVFKTSVLVHKTQIALRDFSQNHDMQALYDATDYLDAAYGFLSTEYLQHNSDVVALQHKLETLSEQLQNVQTPTSLKVKPIEHELSLISEELNHVSESIWLTFEQEYFQLQVDEAQLLRQYEIIIAIILFAIAILGWFAKRQHTLSLQLEARKQQLQELAYYDMLTKIPNRKSIESIIEERIEKAKRHNEGFYVALIDLDDFKKVNDLYSHAVGDLFLIECVKRIQSCVRVNDVLGRFGGDEFLLVFDDVLNVVEIEMILERINKAFEQSVNIENTQHHTNASIGVVHYPNTATTMQELVKLADITMYQAKRFGKGRYLFFEERLISTLKHQHQIEPEIQTALKKYQFELYYQPQINPQTGKIVSAEALVRWRHPERGLITPDAFIPVIENGFMVKEFGEWVVSQAAKQQKAFKLEGIDISISVNLSIKHITMASFFDDITALAKKLDIDLSKFAFEVTEYKMMRYQEQSVQLLNKLAQRGFRFELDDFGTGYSSITHLSQMRFSAIKIDKKFVDAITPTTQKAPLVDAIINMAQALELSVIAEGVETQEQLSYLQARGCNRIQGFYYAKPMSATEFKKFYNKAH